MALENPAFVISAASHSAALFRQALQTLIDGAGVSESTGLVVAQQSSPNMTVQVAPGMVWMPGTLGSTAGYGQNSNGQGYGLSLSKTAQGMYCAYNDATVNLAISAADPSNPRIDLICASVQDAQYSGSTNAPVLQVITGTANASPSAPNAPASSVVLGSITVPAGASSILTAYIADLRPILSTRDGITNVSGVSQYPPNPTVGQYIDDATKGGLLRWNGTAWVNGVGARLGATMELVDSWATQATRTHAATWTTGENNGCTVANSANPITIITPGTYAVSLTFSNSQVMTARSFVNILIGGAMPVSGSRSSYRAPMPIAETDNSVALTVPLAAGNTLSVQSGLFASAFSVAATLSCYRVSA